MARKKQRKGAAASALPAGFANVGGADRAPAWEPDVGSILQGIIMSKRDLDAKKAGRKKAKKGEIVRILTVAAEETGELFNVWESHALKDVCDKAKPGDEIFLRLNGILKRGSKRYKDFSVGLKQKTSGRK